MSEIEIQSSVCEYLQRRKHFFSRINNIPVFDQKRKVYRALPKYTRKGFPDIIVLWKGFPVFLEIKAPKGRQSPEQKEFEEDCKKQAIEYHLIKSIDDVINIGL
jgi:hypothetical protein